MQLCEDSDQLCDDAAWVGRRLLELYFLLPHLVVGLFAVGSEEQPCSVSQ